MPRYDSEWIQVMLTPDLRGSPPAESILNAIGVQSGDRIADIGCGPGFLTLPLARLVGPNGLVDAVDVEESMLQVVRQSAELASLLNVTTYLATGTTIPLPDRSVDIVVCALVLHDLEDPHAMVSEIARIIRPSGKVAIVEWSSEVANPRKNRIRPEVATQLLAMHTIQAGEPVPLPPAQYLIIGTSNQ